MNEKSIKRFFYIFIILVTLLINVGEKILEKRGIVYSDLTILIKIAMTWVICPVSIVIGFNSVAREKLNDAAIRANVLGSGMIFLAIIILFVLRMLVFGLGVLTEDRKETVLEDGKVIVSYENFGTHQIEYYDKINDFLFRVTE